MNEGNIVNLFKETKKIVESPEETVTRFHAKLDEVLDVFQTLSVAEKFEVMDSVVTINKNLFKLYTDLKKRHDFHLGW